ncbi:hypothetical protein H0H93_000157 [Arthromyces matolae]|nr:hypothetical protein H0H93_000157 [Arthromyces matolae]
MRPYLRFFLTPHDGRENRIGVAVRVNLVPDHVPVSSQCIGRCLPTPSSLFIIMSAALALRRAALVSTSSASRSLALRSSRLTLSRGASTSSKEEVDPQLDGYPQLPFVSRQHLPPTGWQDPIMRRNFGDTLHEEEEVLSMWGPDIPPTPPSTAASHFLIAVTAFVSFGFLVRYGLLQDPPAVRREYPYGGLVTELGGLDENKARTQTVDDE